MHLKKYYKHLLTILFLVVFGVYFLQNKEDFIALRELNILPLGFVLIFQFMGIFSNGIFTKLIITPFGKIIGVYESLYLSVISTTGNFFAPAGAGFGLRAIYLKKKYSLPYSKYISILSGNYIIVFLLNSFLGLIALFLLGDYQSKQYPLMITAFTLVFIVSLVLTFVKVSKKTIKGTEGVFAQRVLKHIYDISNGWNEIISHKGLVFRLLALSLANFLVSMFIVWLIIINLSLEISITKLVLFTVLGSFSIFINITPANLGIKEAIYVFSSSVIGFSAGEVLSIAIVERATLFILLSGLWIVVGKRGYTSNLP